MTHPQGLHQHPRLSKAEQAMMGMPDRRILGLPSYCQQRGPAMIIGMPTPIAELSFQGLLSLCLNQTQKNFQTLLSLAK